MTDRNLLQNVYLFKKLDHNELEKIAEISTIETFPPGEDLFLEKDEAHALYVIKYGSVRIHQKADSGENIQVANLGTGSHFGEMAFIDGERRSASATAIERSDVVILDYEKLKTILENDLNIAVNFYRELCHFLSGRLRVTTNDLSFAREKNLSHF